MKRVSVQPFRISRRAVLRGLGTISVALPLLEVMDPVGRARAQNAGPPLRLIVMFSQSGTVYDRWLPTGGVTDFQFGDILAPLEPYRSDIVVIGGLSNEAGKGGVGDDHSKGMGTILTGVPLVDAGALQSGGISLDQEVANNIGTTTSFKSLETGVISGTGSIINQASHAGAGQPLPVENDPVRVFDRIFAGFAPPNPSNLPPIAPSDLLVQRQSILDATADSFDALLPRVSAEDRIKLQAHSDNIRGLEQRLLAAPTTTVGAGCSTPVLGTINARANDSFPQIGQAQLDLIQLAQACDLTRVSLIQFSRESADPRFTWLGQTRGHHAISHDADSNLDSIEQLVAINRWHTDQFVYMLDKLVNTLEGGTRQIDNTIFLWVNGLAKGNIHSHEPHPNVLAGNAGGAIPTGRFLNYADATTNDLYVSVMNALGIPATSFGAFSTGPLPELLA